MAAIRETLGAHPAATPPRTKNMGLVVAASAAGTTFEWYDFFLFVPLASIISKTFFGGMNDSAAYIFALLSFAAGFATRPFGALLFGRIGDRVGRKGTFLMTIGLMGAATFAVGLLPTYAQGGVVAPVLFVALRMLQGIALGGEWGGAAVYIGEHSAPNRRGFMTSWIGTSAAFGLGAALLVVLATRAMVGEPAFIAWGWRIPFLISVILLAISIWIRTTLDESPVFEELRAKGERSVAPYAEAFGQWKNLRLVLIALFSVMVAQGALWYVVFFYAQTFIEKIVKVPAATVNTLMIAVVVASAPLYVFFGWLSDRVGRKPVMLFGMIVVTVTLFPGFHRILAAGNPALAEASARAPVVVTADPSTCALQFDPVGKAQFKTSCDIAKSVLANAGVSYRNATGPSGGVATVQVGSAVVQSSDGRGLAPAALAKLRVGVDASIKAALHRAGYPARADPAHTDMVGVFLVMMLFALGATALYGPQAACLAELFPAKVRYTSLSLPYHIGTGWVGGFLPATAYAMVAASGDVYFGLYYPVVAASIAIVVTILCLPETKSRIL